MKPYTLNFAGLFISWMIVFLPLFDILVSPLKSAKILN